MSWQFGKNHTCDACGHTIFIKGIRFENGDGEPHFEFDGIPKGWTYSNDFGDMCPDCTKRFSRFVVGMFGFDKVPEEWRGFN